MLRLRAVPLTLGSPERRPLTQGRDSASDRKSAKKTEARLRELRDLLRASSGRRVVLLEWSPCWQGLVVVFSTGLVAWLLLDPASLALRELAFDRHLVGRLPSSHVVDVVRRERGQCGALFVSYTEPRVTGLFFAPSAGQPAATGSSRESGDGSARAPRPGRGFKLKHAPGLRLVDLDLVDKSSTTRRVERHLLVSQEPDALPLLLVWWQVGPDAVSPWSAPVQSQRDLANLLVYDFSEGRFEFVAYGSVTSHIAQVSAH